MSDKPENPQAFPHGNPTHGGDQGMTLRDYFAGQALADHGKLYGLTGDFSGMAKLAYQLADAMLKERNNDQS